jgi:methionyl-tRNA synthetase
VVIYVRDFLSRYDADALRYYLSVAGPETQDTDFTWAEFRRRNNDELADSWGNLVNRSVSLAARNFGEFRAGACTDADARAAADGQGCVRHCRRADRAVPAEGRDRRGDAGGAATPTATWSDQAPVEAGQDRRRRRTGSGWARSCTSRCR